MKDRYHDFGLFDFLNDDSFVKWVLFGEGKAFWLDLADSSGPEIKNTLENAREIIERLRDEEWRDSLLLDEEKVLSRIRRKIAISGTETGRIIGKRRNRRYRAMVTISFTVVLAMFFFLRNFRNTEPADSYSDLVGAVSKKVQLREQVNTTGEPMEIRLLDGTKVILKENSRLSYRTDFETGPRETYLSGEAFFEVTPSEKSFYVYANGLVAKVLGTSFEVKAFDDEVRVNVRTGKVSVYNRSGSTDGINPESNGLILLPNQQAIFDRKNISLSKHLSDEILSVAPPGHSYRKHFDEVPASDVLQELKDTYGVNIIYKKELLDSCIISTTLGDEPLFDKLDVICMTIGARYVEIEAQIVIETTGCK